MDFYYVIDKDLEFSEMRIAKLDSKTKQFYDYHFFDFYPDCAKFELGEKVTLSKPERVEKTDGTISKEVVSLIFQDALFHKETVDKYKDKVPFGFMNTPPSIEMIISSFVQYRVENGLDVDLYVIDVLRLLSKAMGLRVRWNNGGTLYNQMSSFNYPEELFEVIAAMYDIISERLANDEHMRFDLYEYGAKGKEFIEFINELERKTRYPAACFGSDLEDRIADEAYHGPNWGFSQRRYELSIMKPTIQITPNVTTYYYDRSEENARIDSTTPEMAKERYSYLLDRGRRL